MLIRKIPVGITFTLLLVGGLMPGQFVIPAAFAAEAPALTDQNAAKELAPLEKRFFAREYVNDPVEKRLERLELLVFGSTQDGDNNERYARLKKAIATRHSESAKAQPGATAPGASANKVPTSSSQYTVLKTLEWRAFKKTYPNDSLDQRLSRLETKAFGAANPSMAYVDRVDRLKRTLGIEAGPATAVAPRSSIPMPIGPAPKARPRGQGGDDFFSFSQPPMIGADPFFGDEDGFGGGSSMGLPRTMERMMREMNRQMQQLEQMPQGQIPQGPGFHSYSFSFELDPKTGQWIDRNTGKPVQPGKPSAPAPHGAPFSNAQPPTFKAPNIAPKSLPFQLHHDNGELPPYSDPNSI